MGKLKCARCNTIHEGDFYYKSCCGRGYYIRENRKSKKLKCSNCKSSNFIKQ